MKAAALPALPIDMADFFMLTGHLTNKQLGAWLHLRAHLWQHGTLPAALNDLAAVARVHPRGFVHMVPVLAPLFDRVAEGETSRWADVELEEQRASWFATRQKRQMAGAAGAGRRWAPRVVGENEPEEAPESMAHAMAHAIAGDEVEAAEEGRLPLASGMASASGAPGPSDRLFLQPKEKIEESDGRTDAPRAGATDGTDDGIPDGTAAVDGVHTDGDAGRDATAPVIGIAMASATPDGMAHAIGSPSSTGTGTDSTTPSVDDATIIAALRKVGGDKIPTMLLTASGIAPVRVLLELGCDFSRDVVPAFEAGVRGLQAPLRSLAAKFIREMAIANRDQALTTAKSRDALARKVQIKTGTAQWTAWLHYLGKTSLPSDVWYVDSEWPPGWRPEAPLAAQPTRATKGARTSTA